MRSTGQLLDVERLFAQFLTTDSDHHFGDRLALTDQHVFLTIGDRERAQDPADTAGSLVRLHLDGSIPPDNPRISDSQYRAELYSVVTAIPKVSRLTPTAYCIPKSMAPRVEMKLIGSSLVSTIAGQPSLMVAIMEAERRSAKAL